jgi:hypothetical protein
MPKQKQPRSNGLNIEHATAEVVGSTPTQSIFINLVKYGIKTS